MAQLVIFKTGKPVFDSTNVKGSLHKVENPGGDTRDTRQPGLRLDVLFKKTLPTQTP